MLHCSFCNKSQHEVRKLIAGPSVFICDECIDLCNDIIREEAQATARGDSFDDLPTPAEIEPSLDQYVIGQNSRQAHAGRGGLQPLQAHSSRRDQGVTKSNSPRATSC